MKLLKFKPTTNSQRHKITIQKSLLSKNNRILKKKILCVHFFKGRSSTTGHITVRHKGGGVKRLFRIIRFSNEEVKGIVITNMYDPNRNAFISLVFDLEKRLFLKVLSTNLVFPGAFFLSSYKKSKIHLGMRTVLKNIPTGAIFHSLSLSRKTCSVYSRAAGTFCQIVQKKEKKIKLKLPSGKIIIVPDKSLGTIGRVSNLKAKLEIIGKAGTNRLNGIRPTVRGIAMNPVDHPHGGRTNGGMHWTTPWGISTKGKKTKN